MYFYKFFVPLLFCCLGCASSNIIRQRVVRQPGTTTRSPPKQIDYSICGKNTLSRIKFRDLFNATLGDWPWHVALGYRRNNHPTVFWNCEGSLISNRWILTPGHCIYPNDGWKLTTARMGDIHLDDNVNDEASPVDIMVEEAIPHPQLVLRPLTNDIALLRLKNPVIFTKNIRPVCVPNTDLHKSDGFYKNTHPYVAGWPYTYNGENKSNSKMLQDKSLAIVDRKICSDKYSRLTMSPIDNRTLCAITAEYYGYCDSDSGGPLLYPIRGSVYVAAIFSFGDRCNSYNNMDHPRVFTKVAYYSDWIRNVTGIKF